MTSQVMTTEQLRTSRQAAHVAPKPVEVGLTSLEGFELAQRIAKMLAASSMVPEAYRDTLKVKDGKDQNGNWIYRDEPNPNGVANCIIAVNMASRLNADPLMIMQNLFPIEGRPSWSSQFVIAAINTSGKYSPLRFDVEDRGEVEVTYTTKEWKWNPQQRKSLPEEKTHTVKLRNMVCKAWAIETGTGERLESAEISMEMAVKEGWYQKNGSKWQTMPEQMLRYRAASFFGRIYAPELLMGIKTYEEEMDAIIDVTPEPVNTAPQTLDSIKQNVVKEVAAEEKPKRVTKSKDAKLIEKFTENLKNCTKDSEFADLRIQVINEDGLNIDQQEDLMRQINERAQEYLASENESTDNNLSVDELKRLQQEAEAVVQQKKQPSSAEMKKEYAKALNTAKSLADVLDIEEQIENDSALVQADFQYLQANIEQVRGKFEQQQAPTVDPLKSGSVKSGLILLISDAKNGEDLRQVAQQMNAAKPNLTSEHQQELLQAYQQKKKLIEDQMDMFPGN
ncbi:MULTISPECIES: recombinase RecT [unclassified Acinetobacter]|uniref:recombinase RecT n=1 Tax=unclassified Acinetobacter TaxID=196816 RepID=UPI0015D1E606|nr:MULTISPECIES: recombinase RecT [unclassified Acinetobacter]